MWMRSIILLIKNNLDSEFQEAVGLEDRFVNAFFLHGKFMLDHVGIVLD